MKAISLHEPWASLIRTGAKTWETRSWATSHRGLLLICAAKGGIALDEIIDLLSLQPFQDGLTPLLGHSLLLKNFYGVGPEHLNFGKAVAIVEVIDCKPTRQMTQDEIGTDRPFGNFEPGRFAWRLNMVRRDFEPFPVRGYQGFFEVDDALIDQQLRGAESPNERDTGEGWGPAGNHLIR